MALPNPTPIASAVNYQRHRPEQTLLYKLVLENLNTFYAHLQHQHGEHSLPDFVKKEFSEFLKCGILAHGFLRAKCDSCKHEKLVAFSCKRRGFCPSCGARRMVESAAHLVDQVFPHKPLRQWVISFPYQLRYLMAREPKVMGELLTIVNRAISTSLIKRSGFTVNSIAKAGAITFVQRFGGSLNLNIHLHMMYLDGVYSFTEEAAKFHGLGPPLKSELEKLLKQIAHRTTKHLVKRGLIEKNDEGYLTANSIAAIDHIQASSITYRIAYGPRQGQKALTLQTIDPREPSTSGLLAKYSGFSLHAGVACHAFDRKKLERICRYIARPSISEERLSLNGRGQVVYKLKKPYDNGTTHVALEPLEFLARLAALVPRPRVNLTRFHGVFAPNFKYRAQVVPKPQSPSENPESLIDKLRSKKSRMTWAQRLKRVFAIDIEACPDCGGKVKIIACIEDPRVIKQILNHMGFESMAPIPSPARGPPSPITAATICNLENESQEHNHQDF